MRRRIRHHVNPLSVHHLDTGATRVIVLAALPLEVELGCAEGEFLFARCLIEPARCYVGVEIRAELVDRVNTQAAQQGVGQVQSVYANLLTDLEVLFAPGSVDLCHINFPDPCFKRSQHKRRFLTPELTSALLRILRPGGRLAFQSDVFELALEAMELLELAAPALVNELSPWSFARDNPFGAQTRRERRCLEREQRIWRLRYRTS
ncbi:MAG: methyltransferase domain-containing protein [bacterium]